MTTGTTVTSYSTIPAGPPQTIVITQTQPVATVVSTSYVTTPITSVSIYTEVQPERSISKSPTCQLTSQQAPSTIYQTSTICKTHWATLTATQYSTVVSQVTQYNTFTAAPSTVTKLATLTINSVLTEVLLSTSTPDQIMFRFSGMLTHL